MKTIHTSVLALLLLASTAPALTTERAQDFIRALAADSDSLDSFHYPEERARSTRLGIGYEGVRWKFLLGYDLDPEVKRLVLESPSSWSVDVVDASEGWAVAHFRVPSHELERAFYFKDGYFVTPVYYYTRDFGQRESRFFTFLFQDPATFHPAAAAALDSFVIKAAAELELGKDKLKLLEREKIIYVLCRDPDEIEQLSGYRIRGMGVVSHDYVVTTYSVHYHEVVHLLAALKLGRVQPVAHPLLREGLAVALGGRGGRDAPVILDVGCFLFRSPQNESDPAVKLVSLDSLCNERAYLEEAVSFSYPASGIYVRFLLDTLGIDRFLELYRKYSHPDRDTVNCIINPADLPDAGEWNGYLERWQQFNTVRPADKPPADGSVIVDRDRATVWDCGDNYCFRLAGDLMFTESPPPEGYRSGRFAELYPAKSYPGCRYLVATGGGEIGVYDLYLNTLLANRVPAFTYPPTEKGNTGGAMVFMVPKSLFAVPLETLVPSILE